MGGIVGGIVGGIFQSNAAGKAARAQEAAANQNIAFQRESRDLITDRVDPFYNSGQNALAALNFELYGGERPVMGASTPTVQSFTEANPEYAAVEAERQRLFRNASGDDRDPYRIGQYDRQRGIAKTVDRYRVGDQVFDSQQEAQRYATANTSGGTPYAGYQQSLGYENQLAQGVRAIDASAASRGGLYSGATLEASQQFGQELADNDYQTYLNRLSAQAGAGQNAAALQATNISNTANAVGNSLGAIGNVQAAGAIGQGNALSGTLNNLSGVFANAQANNQSPLSRQTLLGF